MLPSDRLCSAQCPRGPSRWPRRATSCLTAGLSPRVCATSSSRTPLPTGTWAVPRCGRGGEGRQRLSQVAISLLPDKHPEAGLRIVWSFCFSVSSSLHAGVARGCTVWEIRGQDSVGTDLWVPAGSSPWLQPGDCVSLDIKSLARLLSFFGVFVFCELSAGLLWSPRAPGKRPVHFLPVSVKSLPGFRAEFCSVQEV